jgi:hypothetical protein
MIKHKNSISASASDKSEKPEVCWQSVMAGLVTDSAMTASGRPLTFVLNYSGQAKTNQFPKDLSYQLK